MNKRYVLHCLGGYFCALLLIGAAAELYAFWGVHWGVCFMLCLCFPAIFWLSFQWGVVCDDIRDEKRERQRKYYAALIDRTNKNPPRLR